MSQLKIDTRVKRLIHYIDDIEMGLIQIPEFQRDFIWDNKAMLDFFDSIRRNYPIGSILLWKPDSEDFGKSQNIGPYRIPQEKENFFYVLDGFQRLSTIFGCLVNPEKTQLEIHDRGLLKKFRIAYDLENEEFFIPKGSALEYYQVYVYQLIDTRATYGFERTLKELKIDFDIIEIYLDRYEKLGTTIIDYQLPSIDIIGGKIDEAVEIFSRVNSKGKEISQDWMVSALSYNKNSGFRLGDEINQLIEDLKYYGWGGIKRDVIFNCILNSFGKYYVDQSKRIEQLAKQSDFSYKSRIVFEGITNAVKFLFEELLVVDDKLLPYNNQLIFLTDFFIQVSEPTNEQLFKLKEWFWQTSLSNYFTIYSLSKQRLAYNHFQNFITGVVSEPIYVHSKFEKLRLTDWPVKITFGSVRAKSILLFMLNYSNENQSCKVEDIQGFELHYINDNYSGAAFITLKDTRINYSKIKDIEDYLEKHPKPWLYFIDQDLLNKMKSNDFNAITERMYRIMDTEKDYAKKLKLVVE